MIDADLTETINELIECGDYWSFRVLDPNWHHVLNQLIQTEIYDKDVTDPDAACSCKADNETYVFLRKDEFSTLLVAEKFNVPLPELEETKLICLDTMPVIGDPDPPAPTVGYHGNA